MKKTLLVIIALYMSSINVNAQTIPYKQIQMDSCISQPSTGCDIYQFNHGAVKPIIYDTNTGLFTWGNPEEVQNNFSFHANQINMQKCISYSTPKKIQPIEFCQNKNNNFFLDTILAEYSPITHVIFFKKIHRIFQFNGHLEMDLTITNWFFSPE